MFFRSLYEFVSFISDITFDGNESGKLYYTRNMETIEISGS